MKVAEIKTITKSKFESLEELLSVLRDGEITVYIDNGYEKTQVCFYNGEISYVHGVYNKKPVRIKAEKANYEEYYTLYTNITTYKI